MIASSSLMRVSNNPRAYLLLLLEYSVFLLGDYHFWNDLEKKSVQISVLISKHVPLILSCIFITFISYLINFLIRILYQFLNKNTYRLQRRHFSFTSKLDVCNFSIVLLKHSKMRFQISVNMVCPTTQLPLSQMPKILVDPKHLQTQGKMVQCDLTWRKTAALTDCS